MEKASGSRISQSGTFFRRSRPCRPGGYPATMPFEIRDTVTIRRPLKDVAAFLSNLENEVQYWEGVQRVRLLKGGHGEVGATYERTFDAMGRQQSTIIEVVEHRPNARMVVQSAPGPVTVRGTLWFERLPEATKVNLTLEARPRGLARLFQRKIEKGMTENTRASMLRLKALLERPKAGPGKR